MPPLTDDDAFEAIKKLFEDRVSGKYRSTTFNWDRINIPFYKSSTQFYAATPSPQKATAWIEVVIFVSPWNTKVEGSRSDGKMISKEIDRRGLQALFNGLNSRGMVSLGTESLNSSTTIYRFRREA